jgi:hypothetical protein
LCLISIQAPDIPGIPPADEDDGDNYLAFLVILKNLLSGKSLSIAAPSSYFYLKNFPIENISKVVNYIVYMTYDLHGQVSMPRFALLTLLTCVVGCKQSERTDRLSLGHVPA